jgi:two-component system LytT family sensor kinase
MSNRWSGNPEAFLRKYSRMWLAVGAIAVVLRIANLVATHGDPAQVFALNNRAVRITIFWLLYPAFLPSIFWMARRFPLEPPHWRRDTAIHMAGVVTFAFVHMLAVSFLTSAFKPNGLTYLGWYFPLDLVAYWAAVFTLHYYDELQDREVIAQRLRADLTEVQLRALRSQLNPHFLFNTLNTISVLALKGDNASVIVVLNRLSALLRRALDDSCPQEVLLAQEIEFVTDYLEIQRIRFGDRLVLQWNLAPDTMDAAVPAMILQPLIENAIKHGVAAHTGVSVVTVRTRLEGPHVLLHIDNTGPLIDARNFSSVSSGRAPGIGLANTQSRLQQLYGADQRFDYAPSQSGGVAVTVAIPFRRLDLKRSNVA